jgi:hypothetical protein
MITIDLKGTNEDGYVFGYLSRGCGGWYFVCCGTNEDILDSLEVDFDCGDGGIEYDDAYRVLERFLIGDMT